jgi:polyisoprenoid-binding protein YceI
MTEIPGYVAGTWDIDPVHSEVGFSVRHMAVSKVRGRFDKFEGVIVTGEDPLSSTVTASIDAGSINTNNEQRDGHIKSTEFFEVDAHPTWTFTTTSLKADGGDYLLDGDLTIHGVTKPVTLELELNGVGPDAFGGTRIGFTAKGEINRHDFGVSFNGPIPGVPGGVIVSDKVQLHLEIEGVLRQG